MGRGFRAFIRITILLLALAGILLYTIPGRVSVNTEDAASYFTVSATFAKDIKVNYDNITNLEVVDDFDFGLQGFAFMNLQIASGSFASQTYGSYDMRINRFTRKYIVLQNGDSYLVFNCNGEIETVECYNYIRQRLNQIISG